MFVDGESDEVGDEGFAVAGEEVDDGNLNHGVGSGGETHGCAGYAYEELGGEGGIVDAHAELEALVLSLARDTLAHHVYTVTHILDCIDALSNLSQ